MKAPDSANADGAVIALMDTGGYPVAAGPPMGTAGNDRLSQGFLEAQRMAVDVVGPWQVDANLHHQPPMENALVTAPIPDADQLATQGLLTSEVAGAAVAHGYITGFATMRVSDPHGPPQRGLINAVLRFPDSAAAAAAGAEMAARLPVGTPSRPLTLKDHPEALAQAVDYPDTSMTAFSFDAHGPYVLYQWSHSPPPDGGANAEQMTWATLSHQSQLIDQFVPTDPAKLADLPKDPSGQLLAKTLVSPDNRVPAVAGVWQPTAWLHFEDNPLTATPLFSQAGVAAVSQRFTTVYETTNADGAAHLADTFAAQIARSAAVRSIDGVAGLPTAKCFTRPQEISPPDAMSLARIYWHYKCIGRAGRYAFTAVSSYEDDVRQQMAAQYRILAGQ